MKQLQSESIGKILWIVLWVAAIFTAVSVVNTVIYIIDYQLFYKIEAFYSVVTIFIALIHFILFILYGIWIYKVHMDFKTFFPDHPVTPGKAVGFYFIPFFSLYWLFHVPAKLSRSLKSEAITADYRGKFSVLWPFGVIFFIIDHIFNLYFAYNESMYISEWTWLTADIVYLILLILSLSLLFAVTNSLQLLKTHKLETEQQQPADDDTPLNA
ncbi:hypothetical protein SAMN05421736_11465 [Evansella caseinilytica]|uniref:DUF4328 domain-containing protein n=1 Tax=Evansella caseinilytica TaxID=1503961 RepID=A0A1H3TE71_9BACI|nr:hypothetical protein [Evansella caseinilytica]SDZ48603.1 hypothetical protein SAMN05421736_11465 [Evansella caseinilytica]